MPNLDVTPTPFSTSKVLQQSLDSTVAEVTSIAVTNTTATVNLGSSTTMFGQPILFKSTYAAPTATVTTVTISTLNGSYNVVLSVSKQATSTPVQLVTVSQNHSVVPTNNTVWSSGNSAYALFSIANDAVSYKVAVVVDTVV